jgi:hypothetical protein
MIDSTADAYVQHDVSPHINGTWLPQVSLAGGICKLAHPFAEGVL